MKRCETIKDKRVFNSVIKEGKFYKNKFFVIYIKEKATEKYKIGIAISKKTNCAVERNKLKRRIRTIIDKNRNMFKKDYDYIIMIRKSCNNEPYEKLYDSLTTLLKETMEKE